MLLSSSFKKPKFSENGENGVERQSQRVPGQILGRKASLPTWPPPSQAEEAADSKPQPEITSPSSEKAITRSQIPHNEPLPTTQPPVAEQVVEPPVAAEEEMPPSEEEQDWECKMPLQETG